MMVDTEEAAAVTGAQVEPVEHPLSPVEIAEEAEDVAASKETKQRPEESREPPAIYLPDTETALPLFKMKRFLVLRPGTLTQAIADITRLVDKQMDGNILRVWLLSEVDHWNNEKERLVIVTEQSLLVFKYDFLMFNCEQLQRIPLHFVDRIAYGNFSFPKYSLPSREGEGVRVHWDRQREPSFTSRWNPFATDMPFITFIPHPVQALCSTYNSLCDISAFRDLVLEVAQKANAAKPVPGRANGVLLLNQPVHIDASLGAMANFGNGNKLGYSMARGNLGF
ncbi:tumor protein p63-regulated gene 1 protein [Eucyclogobius newberryi]|uniref:tumor protein p63-regulated gene 1 protein n=1 Tax=Eucyclogobius newberryi TaxID=166745 RepID=UPI003B5C36D7